ncbi:FecR domain-containing protein [Bordetella sp. BOR01]|uniref:FecR domain-containing protein n=1 Tax=Bordetella sp. BOR01 TaxID=2854779 RepID=UPI001C4372DB|nr:FecR family protein [Bordetella sp. BOR01]MBV7483075.1 FecR family protein [Bordetella sp. BOR01]
MHSGNVLGQAEPPVDRGVARQAARWLMRLGSGHATAADVRACDRWRASDAEHERAWQRAQSLNRAFGLVPPAVGMAALGRATDKPRRAVLKAMVALIVAPPVAWTAWQSAPMTRWRADYRTAAGERRELRLADGSRLLLNTSTAVDAEFSDATHALWLREGEIYVETARPAGPPLQVQTRLGSIHVRDAAQFAVRLESQRCRVDVASGQVELRPAQPDAPAAWLGPAQQATFDAGAVYPWRQSDPRGPDWLRGVLHADAMRLDAFAAELARYRPGLVRCDPAVAALRISGAFQLDNTDGILQALPALLPVQVQYRTAYWVTLGPADQA